ncbi:MAG: hypothetical protein AUK44_10330 [Porphyromonadaceae bacterium CG2_30_38_12]|nr:MAG: hypothetical protein AUK44_10330 [Porphyromonadaceae bacterium CG2_30_38_12]
MYQLNNGYKILFFIFLAGLFACTSDTLETSKIDTSAPPLNQTDQWIRTNYTTPYNIEVLYKWNDGQISAGKNVVPPKEDFVKPIMSMLDSIWIQPYVQEAGVDFFKALTPKQFLLIGSPSYNADGSRTQGQAESGRKIILFSVNWFDPTNKDLLWEEYIHVIFHEFAHIMHQTKNYDIDYKNTIPGYTVAWTNFTDKEALEKGFISAYSLSAPDEDFVETMSIFLTKSPEWWDARINGIANATAKAAVQKKLDIVVKYLKNAWNIDAYQLRTRVNKAFERVVANGN